ncbi:MAG: hypothetical protein KDA96_01915 [Planctomycetaceae bacterium]|nr:hypothetical protein [Planctomycetaceae bacterium]
MKLILSFLFVVVLPVSTPLDEGTASPDSTSTKPDPAATSAADEVSAVTEALPETATPRSAAANPTPPGSLDAEGATPEPAESVTRYQLRYVFEPGQKLRYQSYQTITQEAHVGSDSKVDVSKVDQRRVYTVQEKQNDGTAVIRMQFAHIRMQLQTDDKEPVIFDSSMADADVPKLYQSMAHRLKGLSPSFYLLPDGRAVHPPLREGEVLSREEEETRSHEAESFLPPLPDEQVAVGDTWKEQKTVTVRVDKEIKRDVRILQTFRLESVEGEIATITSHASIMSRLRSPVVMAQLMQVTPKGTYRLNMSDGTLVSQTLRYSETVLGPLGPSSAINTYGSFTMELLKEESASSGVRNASLETPAAE